MDEEIPAENEGHMPESDQHAADVVSTPPEPPVQPAPIAAVETFDTTLDQPTTTSSPVSDKTATDKPVSDTSVVELEKEAEVKELDQSTADVPLSTNSTDLDTYVNVPSGQPVQAVQDGGIQEDEAVSLPIVDNTESTANTNVVAPAGSVERGTIQEGESIQSVGEVKLSAPIVSPSTDGGIQADEAVSLPIVDNAESTASTNVVAPAGLVERGTLQEGENIQSVGEVKVTAPIESPSTEVSTSPQTTRVPSPTRSKIPTPVPAKPTSTNVDTTATTTATGAQPSLPANQLVQLTTLIEPTYQQPTESASSSSRDSKQPANSPANPASEPPANQPRKRTTPANQSPAKPQSDGQKTPSTQQLDKSLPNNEQTQSRIPKPSSDPSVIRPETQDKAENVTAQSTEAGGVTSEQQLPNELTLFFTRGSYYSQKVLLALYERDVTFSPSIVANSLDQYEPWFLEVNPKAEIPVLKVGDKYVTESEVIINCIGRLSTPAGNASLVGDSRSASGQTVQRFRRLIDGLNVILLTFGVVFHPQLSYGTVNWPAFQIDAMKDRASSMLSTLSTLADKYPDQRSIYLALTEKQAQRYEMMQDIEVVSRELDHVRRVLSAVEEQLANNKPANGEKQDAWWLCGADFTAADINLLVLLTRLHKLGLDVNFLKDDFPLVRDYYIRASQRPSYQRLLKEWRRSNSTAIPYIIHGSKRMLPYVGGATAVGVVAGVAYWVYKKVT